MPIECRPSKETLPLLYKINHLAIRYSDVAPDGVFEDGRVTIDLESDATKELESLIGYDRRFKKQVYALAQHWHEISGLIRYLQKNITKSNDITQESLKVLKSKRDPTAVKRAGILIESAALLLEIMDRKEICKPGRFWATPDKIRDERDDVPTVATLYLHMGGWGAEGELPGYVLLEPLSFSDADLKAVDDLVGYPEDYNPKAPRSLLVHNWHQTKNMIKALRDESNSIDKKRLDKMIANPSKRGNAVIILQSVAGILDIMNSDSWKNAETEEGSEATAEPPKPSAKPSPAEAEAADRAPAASSEKKAPPTKTETEGEFSIGAYFFDHMPSSGLILASFVLALVLGADRLYQVSKRAWKKNAVGRAGRKPSDQLSRQLVAEARKIGIRDEVIARMKRELLIELMDLSQKLQPKIFEDAQSALFEHVEGFGDKPAEMQYDMLRDLSLFWEYHPDSMIFIEEEHRSDILLNRIKEMIVVDYGRNKGTRFEVSLRPESNKRIRRLRLYGADLGSGVQAIEGRVLKEIDDMKMRLGVKQAESEAAGEASANTEELIREARWFGIPDDVISEISEAHLSELVALKKNPKNNVLFEAQVALFKHVEGYGTFPIDAQMDMLFELSSRWNVVRRKCKTKSERPDRLLREINRLAEGKYREATYRVALRERARARMDVLRKAR